MDNYTEATSIERERQDGSPSRHDSISSVKKVTTAQLDSQSSHKDNMQFTSFPSSTSRSPNRPDSVRSTSSDEDGSQDQDIEDKYARYTHAPPPYSETQYKGKTEEEQSTMRMTDYAKELSRIMGRQIVRGLKQDAKQPSTTEVK